MQHLRGFVLLITAQCFAPGVPHTQSAVKARSRPAIAHPLASDSLPRSRPPPAVRFRQNCLYDGPASFSPGGLPSALDDFLSTYEKPAVLLINIV